MRQPSGECKSLMVSLCSVLNATFELWFYLVFLLLFTHAVVSSVE